MIRHATTDDLPQLVHLANNFWELSGVPGDFESDRVATMGQGLIDMAHGLLLRGGDSMLGAVIMQPMHTANWDIAVELFWYSQDNTGARLYKEFEQWAEDMEADEIRLSSITSLGDSVARFASKREYVPWEVSYSLLL